MPTRMLREGILTSERVASLTWPEEVFYRRLMSVVDDFGRYYATPMLLRAACYPMQLNKVSDPDIEKWIAGCVTAALVRVYPAKDGKRYLELLDFRQQVRAKASKFPYMQCTCAADAKQTGIRCEACAHLDVFGDEDEDDKRRKRLASRLPDDWELDDELRAYCQTNRPDLDPELTAREFKNYWLAKSGKDATKLRWDLTFQNWVMRSNARPPLAKPNPKQVDF